MNIKEFIGLGLRPNHYNDWKKNTSSLWVEVMTDNYVHQAGGRGRFHLIETVKSRPTVMHGVGLNIAGTEPLNSHYLDGLLELAELVQPHVISDHLCFTRSNDRATYDLLPIPYTYENLRWLIHRVNEVQRIIGRRMSFENLSRYVRFTSDEMSEMEFLSKLCCATGCGVLLDVNNVLVTSYNLKTSPDDDLQHFEPWMVTQYHVAGHTNHGDWLHDTHDQPVTHNCWGLLSSCLKRFGVRPVILENDDPSTELETLISEIETGTNGMSLEINSANAPGDLATLQNRIVEAIYTPPWELISTAELNVVESFRHQVEVYRDCFYTRITQTLSDTLLAPLSEEYGSPRVQAWLANYAVENGYSGHLLQDNLSDFLNYLKNKDIEKKYPKLSSNLDLCLARWDVLTLKNEPFAQVAADTSLNDILLNPTARFVPVALNIFNANNNLSPEQNEPELPTHVLFRTSECDLHSVVVPEPCQNIALQLGRGTSLADALESEGEHSESSAEQTVHEWLTTLFRLGGLTAKVLSVVIIALAITNRAEAEVWKEQTRRLLQVSSSILDDIPTGIPSIAGGALATDLGLSATIVPEINAAVGSKKEGVPNAPVHIVPTLGLSVSPFPPQMLRSSVLVRGWVGWLPRALSNVVLASGTTFTQKKYGLEIQIYETQSALAADVVMGARLYLQSGDSELSGTFSSKSGRTEPDRFSSRNTHAGFAISGTHKKTALWGEALAFVRQSASEFFISEDKNLLVVSDGSENLSENFAEGTVGAQLTLGWHVSPSVQIGAAQLIIPARISALRIFLRYQASLIN